MIHLHSNNVHFLTSVLNFIFLSVLQELRLANWLEQVDVTLANTEEVSFDTLQELLETGNSLPQKTGIQVCLQPLKLL